ncbi:MAG: hypothetical protein KF761_14085 [Salinibacterium sp.]|nr:hypothetical protein [Salinibacterium sp.]
MPHTLPEGLGPDFIVRTALRMGVSRRRLQSSDLRAPFHGVRTSGPTQTHLDRCRAYLPRMRPTQFFSHVSAAIIYRMPVPSHIEETADIHVSVRIPAHPPQARGVVGHRQSVGGPLRVRDGFRVPAPAEVWAQLATLLSVEELVVVGDFLVRRKRPFATVEQLAAVAKYRVPGSRALRRALARVRRGTDSPMETRVRLALVDAGLPEPTIGFVIRDAKGDFIGTPDLAYPAHKIAIEYEGAIHFSDARVYADDIVRRELMEEAGWFVIRVISRDLGVGRGALVARVRHALTSRAR